MHNFPAKSIDHIGKSISINSGFRFNLLHHYIGKRQRNGKFERLFEHIITKIAKKLHLIAKNIYSKKCVGG